MRNIAILVALMLVITTAACGGEPTVSDYAEEVERLVLDMNLALNRLDSEEGLPGRTVAEGREYYAERVEIRHTFMDALRALDPPDRVEALHTRALEVIGRLVAVEEDIAAQAQEAATLDDLQALWTQENVEAFLTADAEALELCQAAQAQFDATEEDAIGTGTPWIPEEMREIVRVALACDADDVRRDD